MLIVSLIAFLVVSGFYNLSIILPHQLPTLPRGLYVSATSPPTGILHSVALNVANDYSTPIAGGAQVALDINWTEWGKTSSNTWAAYNLQNVMFYDSEGSGTGVPLNAYLEACGNTTALTAPTCGYGYEYSRVWVKLNATGIPASSSITIYLGFFATTTDNFLSTSNGCTDCWGEAAILTQTNSATPVQSALASANGVSLSRAFTSSVTAGDTIILGTSEYAATVAGPSNVNDSAGNAFTELTVNCPTSPSDVCASWWVATAGTTAADTVNAYFPDSGAVSIYLIEVAGITTTSYFDGSGSHIATIGQYYPAIVPSLYYNGFTVADMVTGSGPLTFGPNTGWSGPTGQIAGSQQAEYYVGFGTNKGDVTSFGESTIPFKCSADCGANNLDWAASAVTFLPSTDHYGNEDNGAYVFNTYYNFNGTSLASNYGLVSLGSGMHNVVANGFQTNAPIGGGNGLNIYYKSTVNPQVVQFNANSINEIDAGWGSLPENFLIGYSTAVPTASSSFLGFPSGYGSWSQALSGVLEPAMISGGSISYTSNTCVSNNPDCVWSGNSYEYHSGSFGWPSTGNEYSYGASYSLIAQAADSTIAYASSYPSMGFDTNPNQFGWILYEFQAFLTRDWTPGNGEMNLQVLGEVISVSQAAAYGQTGSGGNSGQQISDGPFSQYQNSSYGTGGTNLGQQLNDGPFNQNATSSYGTGGTNSGEQLTNGPFAQNDSLSYGTGGANAGQEISEGVTESVAAYISTTQPITLINSSDMNGSYPSFGVSGNPSTCPGSVSPTSILGDQNQHNVTTNTGCQLTLTAPAGFLFNLTNSPSVSFAVCSSVPCSGVSYTYYNDSTFQPLKLTLSGPGSVTTFAISSSDCVPSVTSILGNGTIQTITATAGCQLTLTAPTGYRFASNFGGTYSLNVCNTARTICAEKDLSYQNQNPSSTLTLLNPQALSILYSISGVQESSSATILSVDAESAFTVLGSNFNGQYTISQNASAVYEVPSRFGYGIQVFSTVSLTLFNFTNANPYPYLNMTNGHASIQVNNPSTLTGIYYISAKVNGVSFNPVQEGALIILNATGNELVYFEKGGTSNSCTANCGTQKQTTENACSPSGFPSVVTSTIYTQIGKTTYANEEFSNQNNNVSATVQDVIFNTLSTEGIQITAKSGIPLTVNPQGSGTFQVAISLTNHTSPGEYSVTANAVFVENCGGNSVPGQVGFLTHVIAQSETFNQTSAFSPFLLFRSEWWIILIVIILTMASIFVVVRRHQNEF